MSYSGLDNGLDDNFIMMSDSGRNQYPNNNALSFTNNLEESFVGSEQAVASINALMTNWRINPTKMQGQYNPLRFKIVMLPCQPVIEANQSPENRPNPIFPLYAPALFTPSLRTVFTWSLARSVEAVLNFPEGTDMTDQLAIWTYVSYAITSTWLKEGLKLFDSLDRVSGSPQYNYTQEDISNIPLGRLCAQSNGAYGILSCVQLGFIANSTWFQIQCTNEMNSLGYCIGNAQSGSSRGIPTNCWAYVYNFPPIPDPVNVTNRKTCRYGFGRNYMAFVIIDCISEIPFSMYKTINSENLPFVNLDTDSIRIARLLGLPNDIIIPYALYDIIVNNRYYPLEYQALEVTVNKYILTQSLPSNATWDTTTVVEIRWQDFFACEEIFDDVSDYKNYYLMNANVDYLETYVFNHFSIEVATSDYSQFYPLYPGIKLVQSPAMEAFYSGRLAPKSIIIPQSKWGTTAKTLSVRGFPNAQFYKSESDVTTQGYQLITRQYIPDFFLDNDRLYLMGAENPCIGRNVVGGIAITCFGVILTLSSNAFGIYNEYQVPLDETQWSVISFYLVEASSIIIPRYGDLGTILYASQVVSNYSQVSFMPLTFVPQVYNEIMPILYRPNPSVPETNTMSLFILNEVGQPPEITSFSNKLPFTAATVQLKRTGPQRNAVQSVYFKSGLQRYTPSRKPPSNR